MTQVVFTYFLQVCYVVLELIGLGLCWWWPLSCFTRRHGWRQGARLYYRGSSLGQFLGSVVLIPLIFAPAMVLVYSWWEGRHRYLLAAMLRGLAMHYEARNDEAAVRMLVEEADAIEMDL